MEGADIVKTFKANEFVMKKKYIVLGDSQLVRAGNSFRLAMNSYMFAFLISFVSLLYIFSSR